MNGHAAEDLGFSTTSVLNQRPSEIVNVADLSESKINSRYIKRRAPQPPNGHVPNGHVMNGDASIITEDDENEMDLSHSKINNRYFPNGSIPNGDLSTTSKVENHV